MAAGISVWVQFVLWRKTAPARRYPPEACGGMATAFVRVFGHWNRQQQAKRRLNKLPARAEALHLRAGDTSVADVGRGLFYRALSSPMRRQVQSVDPLLQHIH